MNEIQNIQMYIRPRKYITDTNYIVKIILNTFYQHQQHKHFHLIIFN